MAAVLYSEGGSEGGLAICPFSVSVLRLVSKLRYHMFYYIGIAQPHMNVRTVHRYGTMHVGTYEKIIILPK